MALEQQIKLLDSLREGCQLADSEWKHLLSEPVHAASEHMGVDDVSILLLVGASLTQRVTELTVRLGREAGMCEVELTHVRLGAILHDIGKLGVPEPILNKPGPLTAEEWSAMRRHPELAYEMLKPIEFLRPALDIPYCHHEKWDGSGYPRGLAGESIPLAARLFAVVDVADALMSNRPYRPAWPRSEVYDYIRQQAGTHFDPYAAELYLRATSC